MIISMVRKSGASQEILLIEDNLGDVVLVREALKEVSINVRLNVVEDGLQAMDYLQRKGSYRTASVPDLILLDINLPKKNGMEILKEIKDDPKLRHIPIVVLTTSRSDKDIVKTYGLGASCFVSKPIGYSEFMESVRSVVQNFLPKKPA